MRLIVGVIGVALIGIGIGTAGWGWKIGLCAGIVLLGSGLLIDALKR